MLRYRGSGALPVLLTLALPGPPVRRLLRPGRSYYYTRITYYYFFSHVTTSQTWAAVPPLRLCAAWLLGALWQESLSRPCLLCLRAQSRQVQPQDRPDR